MNRISTNDVAVAMTNDLITIVQSHLSPEHHRDAYDLLFDDFFEVCTRGLSAHDTHVDRIHGRLKPSRN